MAQKRSNPALRVQAGLGNVIAVAAFDLRVDTAPTLPEQDAITWLAHRAAISMATAAAVAAANGWGRA